MLTCGSVFSGVGLLDYGLHLAGLRHAWFCERDEFRRGILAQRWPGAQVLDDVRHVGHGCERVDVFAGGFPCKGASSAGKREGFGHPETVLWREMARAIGELRPRYVLVENVADLLGLHDGECWGEVLGTLAALGFDVVWDCLPAAAVGAPHGRDRVLAVATHADGDAEPQEHAGDDVLNGERQTIRRRTEQPSGPRGLVAADGRRVPGSLPAGGETAAADAGASTHAARLPKGRSATEPRSDGQRTRTSHHPIADARSERFAEQPAEHGAEPPGRYANPERRGVPVEWGPYGPAIRRWEAVIGCVPEPLVRRVDDRRAMRVERSRLSALGDGVQVQVGRIAGEYIIELERGRVAA